jgi:hypothetical protein
MEIIFHWPCLFKGAQQSFAFAYANNSLDYESYESEFDMRETVIG